MDLTGGVPQPSQPLSLFGQLTAGSTRVEDEAGQPGQASSQRLGRPVFEAGAAAHVECNERAGAVLHERGEGALADAADAVQREGTQWASACNGAHAMVGELGGPREQ